MLTIHRRYAAAAGWLLGLASLTAAAAPIVSPDSEPPAVLDRVPDDGELLAITLAPGGMQAIAAFRDAGDKPRTRWLVVAEGSAQPISGGTNGLVRDLVWTADDAVYGIVHRPARRSEGSASLVRIDPRTGKARTLMRLPPTASDLEPGAEPDRLLLAARNEVRVLLLDPVRSGPLHRIAGDNLALAALADSEALLVGRSDGLLLVHLGDPSGDDGLPVRSRLETDAAVVGIAPRPDGGSGLLQLADGRVMSFGLTPPSLAPRGRARGLVGSVGDPAPLAASLPDPPAPPAPRPVVEAEIRPAAPEPVVLPEPTPAPPAAKTEPAAPPETTAAPPAGQTESPGGPFQLAGRLLGPAAARVRELVVLGPDNLLREAARVAPSADGHWGIDGLAPGRYRIQVDGGGGSVMVCRPPFVQVEVRTEPVIAPDIEVLRAL